MDNKLSFKFNSIWKLNHLVPEITLMVCLGAYSREEKLLMHFFQDILAGAAVIWYTNLEASRIRTWKDLTTTFLWQYQYNSEFYEVKRVCFTSF